jgi:phage terminase small subunit
LLNWQTKNAQYNQNLPGVKELREERERKGNNCAKRGRGDLLGERAKGQLKRKKGNKKKWAGKAKAKKGEAAKSLQYWAHVW